MALAHSSVQGATDGAAKGPAAEDTYVFPASFAQQRLWLLEQLQPGTPTYNVPAALRLEGALDVVALEASLQAIVQRHEALRTTFGTAGGELVQIVAATRDVVMRLTDLSALPLAQREREAQRLIAIEAETP